MISSATNITSVFFRWDCPDVRKEAAAVRWLRDWDWGRSGWWKKLREAGGGLYSEGTEGCRAQLVGSRWRPGSRSRQWKYGITSFFYEKNMESHVSESPSARHGVYGPSALSRRPQPIDWNQLRDGLSRAPAGATTAHISVAAQTLTVTGIFAERKQLAVLILLYKHKISLLNYWSSVSVYVCHPSTNLDSAGTYLPHALFHTLLVISAKARLIHQERPVPPTRALVVHGHGRGETLEHGAGHVRAGPYGPWSRGRERQQAKGLGWFDWSRPSWASREMKEKALETEAPFASLKKQVETLFRLKKQAEKYGL